MTKTKTKPLIVPAQKPRNPLVQHVMRKAAQKHKNKKREQKYNHQE